MATAELELTSETSHEQIQAYVDQVVEDRKGDAPEQKGDAQKIAEERDKPVGDTSAETDSGSEDAAPEGEKPGKKDAWLDDDLKAEVSAYGIDEKELADFTSREEVERALRFFDRSALEAGRKAMAEGEQDAGKTRDEHGRFAKKEPEPEKESKEGNSGYELTPDFKTRFDEGLVDELTRMRDHYESRLATLEERFSEVDARAEEERFDTLVDALGHNDLFGKSGKETQKELDRRQDLFVSVKAHQIGLRQLGREVDLDEALVTRVARMVFADEFDKKNLKARTKSVFAQANRRGGDGTSKSPEPQEDLRAWARREYKRRESG